MMKILGSFAACFVLAACAGSGLFSDGRDEGTNEADRAAILAVSREAVDAYVARDWVRFKGLFAEDGIWMPPNKTALIGEEAWWSQVAGGWNNAMIDGMDVNTEEIIVAGDWAFKRHTEAIVYVNKADGKRYPRRYKGVWLLHRESDGSWKIARYIWNDGPASD